MSHRGLLVAHVVNTSSFAGVERHVALLANEQAQRGMHVTVLGGSEREMEDVLVPKVDHRPYRSLILTSRQLRSLRNVDVIHAHMTSAETSSVLALAGRPIVSTRHFAQQRGRSSVGRMAAPVLGRAVDLQIAVSQFVANRIDGTSTVIYNAVENSPYAWSEDARYILVAQRLAPEKATDVAIQSFIQSGIGREGWRLLIAGDGPEGHRLRKQFNGAAGVEFLGFRRDVLALMSGAACVLAPAPAEPFGLSVVEAMARGVPVVAAAGGGHRETVGRVAHAALFRPHDVADAARWLRKIASEPRWGADYGQMLRSVQRSIFTSVRQERATFEAYRKVV